MNTGHNGFRISDLKGPVLLIGTGGMLARAWEQLLAQHGVAVVAPTLAEFDLTKPQTVAGVLDERFSLVVNAAAWTDVDGAEAKEAIAAAVNGTGVGSLAQRCAKIKALLVHYSTDYVFNGQAAKPYLPDAPREPLNAYGRTKAQGEVLIEQSGCPHLIIRTSWLYAPWGNNFVRTIARLAKQKPVLRVVNDQRGRPTSAEHLARTSLRLILKQAQGIYHVTDGGECSWCDFAGRIAAFANPACRVEPCTTAEFPRPAQRPAYSTLDLSKTETLLGPMPDWQHNLDDVLRRLES